MKLKEQPKLKKCRTVGALIKQLETLPKTLPIRQSFGLGVQPVVYNVKTDAHLEFEEVQDE